jgi:hypothetical protein
MLNTSPSLTFAPLACQLPFYHIDPLSELKAIVSLQFLGEESIL